MAKLVCLIAGLALMLAATPCFADPPDPEQVRLRAEVAKLRQENAALKKLLKNLAPVQGDFRGVLKERSVTLYTPPQVTGSGTSRQEMRLVLDLGNGLAYDLIFKGVEEQQKARSWKGIELMVHGSVQTIPENLWAREFVMFPSSSGFPVPPTFFPTSVGRTPPSRWILVVESWRPVGEGKNDQENLQGTWRVVGLGADGLRLRAGHQLIKDAKLVITGNRAVFMGNGLTLVGSALKEKEQSFDFVLDHSTKPSEMQFSNNKEVLRGIYQLNGDDLNLCFLRDGEARVSTDFTATSGRKRWLYLLRRERSDQGEHKKK
jgi:uncharacterized protein (TIGR03067 family)